MQRPTALQGAVLPSSAAGHWVRSQAAPLRCGGQAHSPVWRSQAPMPEAEEGYASTSKFTIPGYRAALKASQAAPVAEEARVMEAPPTAPTDLAARAQGAAAAGDQWVLAASGALGVALFAAGAVVERTQAARDRA